MYYNYIANFEGRNVLWTAAKKIILPVTALMTTTVLKYQAKYAARRNSATEYMERAFILLIFL
jgi:heme/copper-type cytochrome/quinol oxidase subunit 2